MKRWKKILLIVLVLAAVLLAGFAWRQRENLVSLARGLRYSREELEEQLVQNNQQIKDAMTASPDITVRDVTEEEREALKNGELTAEDLVKNLLEPDKEAEQPMLLKPQDNNNAGGNEETVHRQEETKNEYQRQLSELIARVYVIREHFLLALDNLEQEARAEYAALPKEKRTKTELVNMASRYLGRGADLEKECDQQMDNIISELERLIRDNEGDMGLIDTVVYTYANEKSIKKSIYMAKLEEKGLI